MTSLGMTSPEMTSHGKTWGDEPTCHSTTNRNLQRFSKWRYCEWLHLRWRHTRLHEATSHCLTQAQTESLENPEMTSQWLTSPEMTSHENTRGNEPSSHSSTNWNLPRLLRSRSTASISGDLAQTGASPVSWGKGVTLNPRPGTSPCLDFPRRISKERKNTI